MQKSRGLEWSFSKDVCLVIGPKAALALLLRCQKLKKSFVIRLDKYQYKHVLRFCKTGPAIDLTAYLASKASFESNATQTARHLAPLLSSCFGYRFTCVPCFGCVLFLRRLSHLRWRSLRWTERSIRVWMVGVAGASNC